MIDKLSKLQNNEMKPAEKNIFGWLLFPLSLFPLVALMTYDWRASALRVPATPSSNWFGALGDAFAYYGYQLFGLAIWIVPIVCIVGAICIVVGHKRPGRRSLWFMLFLLCAACLMQVTQHHAPGISAVLEKINLANAGGALGYLLMTRLMTPLLSDFGASIVVLSVMIVSLIAFVGLRNLGLFFLFLYRWALGKNDLVEPDENATQEERERYENALRAREEAERQRQAEREQIQREKAERKEAALRAKEEAKLARQRLKEERAATATGAAEPLTIPPPPPPSPARIAKPAAAKAATEEKTDEAVPDKGPYILPPMTLLNPLKKATADHSDVNMMSQKLVDTLKIFKIDAEISYTVQGPVVTKYALLLAPGTLYSKVTSLADNIKGALHAKSLRIEAPIPGEEAIGIEVPNLKPVGISFREVFESDAWRNANAELPLLFGKDAAGKELVADLATMPHMLVAGATGQGKSVCLNSLINGLLMTRTPEQLKFIMVDPKSVEFTPYASIPHLLVPVITDNRRVVFSLKWAVKEMEDRLKMFARARVKNIYDFNHRKTFTQTDMFGGDTEVESKVPKTIPYIVIIIDEVADLMAAAAKEVTPDIARLTAKARAAGIHLILATQRPDAKVITGTIKANIPGRVAFKTAQAIDSRTILDDSGAENLIGRGDMLFKGKDGLLIRAQGAWISDDEIANITSFIEQHANTQFDEKFATKLSRVKEATVDDPFASNEDDPDNQVAPEPSGPTQRELVKAAANADDFKKAVECLINTKRASTSHFQRQMGWGYNHAAKILDMLTEKGIVSPQQGMGPRQILLDQDQLIAIMNGGDATDVAGDAPLGDDTSPGGDAFLGGGASSVGIQNGNNNLNNPLDDEEEEI